MAAEDSDIALIDGGIKLLTSKDPIFSDVAWAELNEDAAFRFRSYLINGGEDFLNSNKHDGERVANRYASPWTKARMASSYLGVKWSFLPEKDVTLNFDDITINDRRAVFRILRNLFRKKRTMSLN